MPRYRVGCTGWGYDDWAGPFYPEGAPPAEYLARYSRVFDTTEIDSSFYRPPSPFLARRWATQTPDGFLFAAKVPQDVTHRAREPFDAETLSKFLTGVEPLRAAGRLGPLVAQFPPSFRSPSGAGRLQEILDAIPRSYRLAVELRHASWWEADTMDRLEARGAALIWSVFPGVHPPYRVTADFVYARFVGDRALTKFDRIQREGRPAMEEMKRRFESEGLSARDIFVLLNNHFMGFGPGTAQVMQEVLGVPKADLSAAGRDPGQQELSRFG
ncbi:MAG TPA: DUF72 domain-containing protein [Thermoplasmata archaeon]